jgi:hypothetical protein
MHTVATEQSFDLAAYARQHRYRLRNLRDGNPVPPMKPAEKTGMTKGHWAEEDRMDAIIGRDGYIAMDGVRLSVCLFYGSAKGVNGAIGRLEAIGGQIDQVGDTEVGATVPVERIDEVLKIIKVFKLPLRNPRGNPNWQRSPVSERVQDAESHERSPKVHSVHPTRVGTV